MNKKGLGYNEMVEIRRLLTMSNICQRRALQHYYIDFLNPFFPQETRVWKNQKENSNKANMEVLHS